MKNVYIFSGLGADYRVFHSMDFSGYNTTYIQWLGPFKYESIEDYAMRISGQIIAERPILVGLSFGGMMAIEIAKFIPIEKIILIASAQTKDEIPIYYRIAGLLNLHKLVPLKLLKRPNKVSYWFLGITNEDEKKLLTEIFNDNNLVFSKWAIDKIFNWTNMTKHKNIKHIHGSADRVLPIRNVNFDLKVDKGGHFMTVTKADELTKLVRKEIG